MGKFIAVSTLIFTLLLIPSLSGLANAQSCTSPGSGSSSNYQYDSAANTYVICTILSAQATVMAYTPTSTPTVTPTATLAATPAAIATLTGCYPNATNDYRNCVIADLDTRVNTRSSWWLIVIAISIVMTAIFLRAKH